MDNRINFKKGDRAFCTGSYDGKNFVNCPGIIKKIVGINPQDIMVIFDFDDDIGGWSDTSLDIKPGHGWGLPISMLVEMKETEINIDNLSMSIDEILGEI